MFEGQRPQEHEGDEPFRAAEARIVAHMNDDHADAVADIARVQGGLPGATYAEMTGCDRTGCDLLADTPDGPVPARVTSPEPLETPVDARRVLIGLVQHARRVVGGSGGPPHG